MAETLIAIATLVTAIGAVIVGWRNSRKADQAREKAIAAAVEAAHAAKAAQDATAEIIATKEGVFEVGKQIDGRLTQLLELTRKSAYAAGQLAGPDK